MWDDALTKACFGEYAMKFLSDTARSKGKGIMFSARDAMRLCESSHNHADMETRDNATS